eukprot:TRINITY_DN489_c0_g1_i1.p1 TRINITY_DN489_c0_g1~~TRINITY_DN489_c0_g1_i1.p1  ORF type:complete len:271 (-),score=84.84 TRINITY_DN489_c0_g1_i1:95-850(-)
MRVLSLAFACSPSTSFSFSTLPLLSKSANFSSFSWLPSIRPFPSQQHLSSSESHNFIKNQKFSTEDESEEGEKKVEKKKERVLGPQSHDDPTSVGYLFREGKGPVPVRVRTKYPNPFFLQKRIREMRQKNIQKDAQKHWEEFVADRKLRHHERKLHAKVRRTEKYIKTLLEWERLEALRDKAKEREIERKAVKVAQAVDFKQRKEELRARATREWLHYMSQDVDMWVLSPEEMKQRPYLTKEELGEFLSKH